MSIASESIDLAFKAVTRVRGRMSSKGKPLLVPAADVD